MARPTYESDEDRDNERRVIEKLASGLEYTPRKLPALYALDFALCDEDKRIKAFVEIKCRTVSSQQYRTVFVSLDKVERARALSRTAQIPVYLLVDFTDGIFMLPLSAPIEFVTFEGRTDRGDRSDLQPMAHYPIQSMSRLSVKELDA